MTPDSPPPARLDPRLLVVYLTVFLDILGFGVVIPLLPLYARQFQASALEIGLLMACYSAAQMLFAPVWGALSDRIGRRPVILVSLLGSTASYAVFAASSSLAMLFVGRTLAGVCAANLSAAQAYVADVTSPEQRTRGMGMIGAAFGLGFVLGPALGGLSGRLGPRAPFIAASCLCALDLLLAATLLEEPRPRGERSEHVRPRARTFTNIVRQPQLVLLLGMVLLVTFAFANLESMFTLFLHERFGYGADGVAGMFVMIGVIMVIMQGGVVGRLSRRVPEPVLIRAGTALLACGLLLLPQAHSVGLLVVAVALFSSGSGLNHPSLSSLTSHHAGPDHQGAVLGVAQAMSSLGRIFGPMFGGFVYDRFGQSAPYVSGGSLMIVACLLSVGLQKRAAHRR